MKCKIPEISWHNRDPVLSVDIQPKTDNSFAYRLASGGTDSHVLIWSLSFTETSEVLLEVVTDLTRHQRAVNVVKWSPNSELLASGDDESVVIIWKQKEDSEPIHILESSNEHDKEIWITLKVLRGHMEDVYDLSWSPNSQYLVSGSVDNTAIIWDVHKGKSSTILNDHKGFVQGVAWDPKNQYIATLSTDRFLRIFDIHSRKVIHRISKCSLPVNEKNDLYGKKIRLYHDDTLQTFFRRLCFSPDGKLLFTPAGVMDYDGVTHLQNATYVYSRHSLKQPSIILPSDQYTVAVKCCPVLFKLRRKTDIKACTIPLPYRIIFAVATKSSVYLYDTQQKVPFGIISNIHYTRLTDITWSSDGRIMIVSSTDGFCSLITFEEGELGEEYKNENLTQSTFKGENEMNKVQNVVKKLDSAENICTIIDVVSCDTIVRNDIISIDEKFEPSNEENRVPTPIVIRREPRNTNKHSKPTSGSTSFKYSSCTQTKTEINEFERQPRTLIPCPVETTPDVEEAMDGWPQNQEKGTLNVQNQLDVISGCTEDIRLVYEDTVNDIELEPTQSTDLHTNKSKATETQAVLEHKTPRRVELKTISTPKRKKNLLE